MSAVRGGLRSPQAPPSLSGVYRIERTLSWCVYAGDRHSSDDRPEPPHSRRQTRQPRWALTPAGHRWGAALGPRCTPASPTCLHSVHRASADRGRQLQVGGSENPLATVRPAHGMGWAACCFTAHPWHPPRGRFRGVLIPVSLGSVRPTFGGEPPSRGLDLGSGIHHRHDRCPGPVELGRKSPALLIPRAGGFVRGTSDRAPSMDGLALLLTRQRY